MTVKHWNIQEWDREVERDVEDALACACEYRSANGYWPKGDELAAACSGGGDEQGDIRRAAIRRTEDRLEDYGVDQLTSAESERRAMLAEWRAYLRGMPS